MKFNLLIIVISAIILIQVGCTESVNHKGKTPIVQVGNEYLYKEDLFLVMPLGIKGKDSVDFVNNYIRNWIYDALLYKQAEGNIPDNDKIDDQVKSYRKALITHSYVEQLVNQELRGNISEEEIENYYALNSNAFQALESYIKGIYIKVPKNASGITNLKKWYKDNSESSIDKIEKFGIKNAVDYEYFYDTWRPFDDFIIKLPSKEKELPVNIHKNTNIEMNDSSYFYFMHIDDVINKGEVLPLEYARNDIKEILVNTKRIEYISQMKSDLYNEASANNEIKYFNDSNE